ncbi:ribonuclease H-like domain-containing protein [Candidatus Uhrbacteria bacterium]|nr:ribonuclease H-like domain-containing protein [Candidatus Uhrbacteria bacterium]
MSKEIVLDIETQNTFQEVGKYDHTLLRISLVGAYFYETDTYESFLEHELPSLWPRLERAERIVGYNSKGFDLPVMNNYYAGDLLRIPQLDIMEEIQKHIGFRVKLDDVAHGTLGMGKSGNGLMAVQYFRQGEMEKLRDYCLQDVKVTKAVYEHGLAKGELKYYDNRQGKMVLVPVKFNRNLAETKPAINLTMPF